MKQLTHVTLLLLLGLVSASAALGQNFTNRGREFWVAYGHHQFMERSCDGTTDGTNTQNMVLYLSAEQPAIVTVTIDSSNAFPALPVRPLWTRTYTIPANTVIQSDLLPKGAINAAASGTSPNYDARLYRNPIPQDLGATGLYRGKGIRITSNVPIVAYAHIYGSVSSAATMLLPTETWGYSYTSINTQQRDADRSYSWMYIVAKDDNTRVRITPAANARPYRESLTGPVINRPAGVPFTVNLMKGQIFQYVAESECTSGNGPELTGTTVKSIPGADGVCKPIAVFSGSSRTGGETLTCGTGSGRDNDMQQCFPEQAWGKRYLTTPFSKASSVLQPSDFQTSVFKVVVKDPNTVVRRNGVPLTGLISGQYYRFSSNTADYIDADKPIMVAQFMSGTGICNGGQGDPEMIYLSPIEQAINNIGFFRNTREAITHNYLTLVVPTEGLASLRIDNSAIFNHTYPHPQNALLGRNYTVVVRGWTAAQAQCLVQCDSGFTAITYGLGGAESYGYNAGTYLKNLVADGELYNEPDTTNTPRSFTCSGTPMQLAALLPYKPTSMNWKISSLGGVVIPGNDVFVSNPVPVDSVMVGNVRYYRYRLPGTYIFNTPGTYDLPIINVSTDIDNCSLQETAQIKIVVRPKPNADFTYTHSGCRTDSVTFNGPGSTLGTGPNAYTIAGWRWSFGDGTIDSVRNPRKLYGATGTYSVRLVVNSTEGCLADTTKPVVITPGPQASIVTSAPSACIGSAITFTDTTSITSATFYWDFGFGTPVTSNSNTPQVVNFPAPGTYIVKHVVTPNGNCVTDTVRRTFVVYARPNPTFTFPSGCLPVGGVVQFNSTANSPDSQAIASHAWNFGDPNANAGNPNTSTAQNPTHTYSYGTYNINYQVTTINGCVKDTTIAVTFNIRPQVAFTALTPLCESATPITFSSGSVMNNVPGTGIYIGPGTSANGAFQPALAGPGVHTIQYAFTSAGGCSDTAQQTIRVWAAPRTSFTFSNGCLPTNGLVQFSNSSTISDGQTLSYLWNFGDPNANAGNPNTSTLQDPTHNYSVGNYNIRLTASTPNGCSKDTTVAATFNVRPALSYPALTPVCENVTPFSVASAVVTNNVPGSGTYKGPGTDAAGLFRPAIAGPGVHTIWFVYNANGGCLDSVSQSIRVNAAPRPSFTFSNGCLPTDGLVQFTNTTTIADAQTLTYNWNFGDPNANAGNPNTSTAQNPNHNYQFGNYTITLSVQSSNGCSKDTTVAATFNVRPLLSYPALAAVCENLAPLSVASAVVTNNVPGLGTYRGPGTTAAGQFNPAVAGPGTHTIWYVYNANGACLDSISQTIRVNAAPRPAFTTTSGCLPAGGVVSFTNSSTIADAQAMTYQWNFGDQNANAGNPNTSTTTNPTHAYSYGTYPVNLSVTSSNGCIKDTTINVTANVRAQLSYGALTAVCENVASLSVATGTVTNAVPGTGIYSGPGTNAAGQFNPAAAGPGNHTIKYVFTSAGGCVDSISRTIVVYAAPKAAFTFSNGCLPVNGLVQFTNTSTISDAQTLTYLWNFGDPNANAGNPNTSTVQNPTHLFVNGNYNIRLNVNSSNGCSKDTTIAATFNVKPQLSYGALTAVCENISSLSVASATVSNAVPGTGVYSGPGTDAAGNFRPGVAGPGTHTIKYVFTSSGGCADSVTQTIRVHAKPVPYFTFPVGCLPVNGLVQFSNATTIADGQTLTYNWSFNDPNASAGNPNTSTVLNPTHNYFNTGSYNIRLTATSANGCIGDTTRTTTFSVKPQLTFAQPSSVCQNTTGITLNSASVVNGVTGTGAYYGAGTSGNGTFNADVAGAGTHVIRYIFTSTGGCVDSVSGSIKVFPKPNAAFTVNANICVDQQATFQPAATIPSGNVVRYNWNFGDGNTISYSNNNTFTRGYTSWNTFTVKLVAISDSNCVSDTATQLLNVRPLPVANFNLPNFVCMPGGTANFGGSGTVADNSPLTYSWDFGDGNTSVQQTPAHSYSAIGSYPVRLTVTSPYGCSHDTVRTFSAFYDKPVASFAVSPDTLCQGSDNVFTDASFAPNSTINNWTWNFGDNSQESAQRNPIKRYTNPGNYVVSLTVKNAFGCTSDPYRDTVIVYLQPRIDAGPSFVVSQGTSVTFRPQVNGINGVQFTWSPTTAFTNPNVLQQTIVANRNQTYTLTAVGQGNCAASDTMSVKILMPVVVPNSFSPNGDGINDQWIIPNLIDYPGMTVEVYNRYGQMVFQSVGYSRPWDGSFKGQALPFATYYYIINLKNGYAPLTGTVTIVK